MLNFAHFGPMSQFPPSPYGCFGSSPLIGPYGWFGGSYGQVVEQAPPSPTDKAKALPAIKTANGLMPIYGGPGGYPGFGGLPPQLRLPPQLLWQMRKYSTIQLALAIVNGPWLAGNEEIEVDPYVPDGLKNKADEWKQAAERYVDPIWQRCKFGAAESVALGNFLFEIKYEYQKTAQLMAPVRARPHLATRVDMQLMWDESQDFSGFRVNGQERDSRYAFLAVNEWWIDEIFGYSRSENCVDSWWRALQSNLNADKTEQKASGIQFGVGSPMGATFTAADGKQVNVDDFAQKLIQSASVGNCFTFPLFLFGQEDLKNSPELAAVSPFKFERFDWGDVGPNLLASIARLGRTDIEIIRAYHRPEREAMEAMHGSRADSASHGAIGTTDSEMVHAMLLGQFSKQVLDRFCVTNFPGYEPGMLRYKATPLSDPQQEFLQKVAVALATDQSTGPELTKNFDLRGLAQRVEMPVLSEEDVKANEVIAQKKAADAQQQAIDLAKASAKPLPANGNGKAATNGSPAQNGKPRIAASADARPHLSRLLGDMLNEPRMTHLGDEYDASDISEDLSCESVTHVDRIDDMETTLALGADESGHWVTIEGEHVFINDAGKIVKGPANLEGKSIDELPQRSTPDAHHHDQKNPEVSPDEHKRKWIAAYRKNAELDRKEQEKREAKKKPVGRKHDGKSRSDRPNPKMRPPRPDEVRSRKISSVIGDFAKSKGLQSWQLEMSQEQKENLLYEHRDQLRFISASADARPNLGDEYEPDESPIALAADVGDGHWVTIEGEHVFISGSGRIEKGPKNLTGKNIDSLPPRSVEDVHHHERTDPASPPTEVPHTHPGKSVMYHGSSAKFSTFTHDHVSGENKYGPASYFTPDPDEAKQWNADHVYTAEVTHDSPFRIDRDIQPEHGERINAAAAKLGKQGLDKGFEKNSQAYSSYQNLARNNGDSKATANAILREAGFDSIVDKHELASLEPGKAKVLLRESKDAKLSGDFTGKIGHA